MAERDGLLNRISRSRPTSDIGTKLNIEAHLRIMGASEMANALQLKGPFRRVHPAWVGDG